SRLNYNKVKKMKRLCLYQAPHSWGFLFVKMMMGRFGYDESHLTAASVLITVIAAVIHECYDKVL
ncbi:MAG TPA: hypothetical protein DIS65_06140, partial [Candidatus Marinimicrobia bacterium]|nr:hypothetical protein [Candidatus Neomarinimicrobiota bacterium]